MDKLIKAMKSDFEELHQNRQMSRAKLLSEQTGMHVNHNEYPAFFFGDPKAKFVLVHLNPKQQDNQSDSYMTPAVKSVHLNLGDFNYAA